MWDIGGLSNHVLLTYHFHLVSAHLRAADVSNLTPGGGLYNDYAVLALYDGAQLLLAVLLVILGGGLAVQLSLLVAWKQVAVGPFSFGFQLGRLHIAVCPE